jgi:hypothetical protein
MYRPYIKLPIVKALRPTNTKTAVKAMAFINTINTLSFVGEVVVRVLFTEDFKFSTNS